MNKGIITLLNKKNITLTLEKGRSRRMSECMREREREKGRRRETKIDFHIDP